MLMKTYQMAFFATLMAGTVIACSANSWFTCWIGLEINLMSLIPLLIVKLTPLSTETAIKYFMAQAMASLMIIFSSLGGSGVTFLYFTSNANEIIITALCIKAGMAPFHFWFPQVMKISSWPQCLMILTWQKIAPFILMVSCASLTAVTLIIAASAAVGSLGGLNQTDAKMILTYSSIAHSAWMLAICASSSLTSWGIYFIIYVVISISIIVPLYKMNINSINQMMIFKQNSLTKISLLVSVLSLGGLPPFLGFLAKLGAIQLIMSNMSIILAVILITASLISLYYYMRVIYFLVLKTSKINLINEEHNQPMSYIMATMSLGGNITAPLMVLLT